MDETYYPRATRERADKIPDDFFDDNPEVIQCREVLAAAEEAHEESHRAYQAAIGTLRPSKRDCRSRRSSGRSTRRAESACRAMPSGGRHGVRGG
jgi:hypothetical protein